MKKKQIIILISILCFVLVLGIWKNVSRARFNENSSETKLSFNIEKNYDQIELKKGGLSEVILKKENDGWHLPGRWNFRADSPRIEGILNALTNLTGEFRGERPEILQDFQITDAEAFHVIFSRQNKPLINLVLSPKVPEKGGVFIRLQNSNAVYLVNDSLFALFGIFGDPKPQDFKEHYWLDLNFARFDTSKVNSIILRRQTKGTLVQVFELTRNADSKDGKGNWSFKGLELPPVTNEKVELYLSRIKKEQAQEMTDPNGSYGFNSPDVEIVLKNSSDSGKVILLKKMPEKMNRNGAYVQLAGEKEIYLISEYTFQTLNVEPKIFTEEKSTIPSK